MAPHSELERLVVDGNEAAARVAHKLAEVIAIYPITPASPMGELADAWSAAEGHNLWGQVPEIVEMQSEAGAAGAVHGALQGGSLATTFTASQGLLLMLPEMFKIAGELQPCVFHVAARAVAGHALSIFGDHSDVYAARPTGFAMLASASVQEAQDMAALAFMTTLESRVPFVHFFDGFRTSHEINVIDALSDDDLRALVDEEQIAALKERALSPDHPTLRGSAQNPDVFFQAREASSPFYAAVPRLLEEAMLRFARRTGRSYRPFEYVGHPQAEQVVIAMGSATATIEAAVRRLNAEGERVGLLTVRLYRPFSSRHLAAVLPFSTQAVAVLDRAKDSAAVGEPLYEDVVAALLEEGRLPATIIGGRYGLGSKEFTPAMARAVFEELARRQAHDLEHVHRDLDVKPHRHFTVGIDDDVSGTSLAYDPEWRVPQRGVSCLFYGLGSDGTVGANKNSAKIIATEAGRYAQAYFVYDSKKSGAVTVSHLRFGDDPIEAPYLIEEADFVACHQFRLLERIDVLEHARPGATFLLSSPHGAGHVAAPSAPGAGADRRQAAPLLRRRRKAGRPRGRPGGTREHGPPDLLLRALRRAPRRRGDRGDQARDREELRPQGRGDGPAQLRRGGRSARRPPRDRARRAERRSESRTTTATPPPSCRRCSPGTATNCRSPPSIPAASSRPAPRTSSGAISPTSYPCGIRRSASTARSARSSARTPRSG